MAFKARSDAQIKVLADKIMSFRIQHEAGAAMGLSSSAIQRILSTARSRGIIPPVQHQLLEISPLEKRNEKFWKERAASLAAELSETKHILNEVSGLMAREVRPPKWSTPSSKSKHRAVGILCISDIHAGEVVRPEEIGGLNEYNLEVCRERLRRLFSSAIRIIPRWSSDCKLEGVYVPLNGDLVSGDIHDELRRTNALTAQQQVYFIADELAAGIKKLADAFGYVYVCVTPGNHGRSTPQTHAKQTAALSYDTMVGEQLRRYFSDDRRIVVHVAPGRDAVYEVFGKRIFQSHHDQGGGGGQGFAGPLLPVLRKGKSLEYAAAQSRIFYDVVITAHHHTSGNLGKILANGSVIGYNEFAQSIRAAPEPPQQWLAIFHERWGLRERSEIKL